jgi:hypothetical protein
MEAVACSRDSMRDTLGPSLPRDTHGLARPNGSWTTSRSLFYQPLTTR